VIILIRLPFTVYYYFR